MEGSRPNSPSKRSIKSDGSKASISVTLPVTDNGQQSPVQIRSLSPGRSVPCTRASQPAQLPHTSPSGANVWAGSGTSSGTKATTIRTKRNNVKTPMTHLRAIQVIERAWLSYQDRQMFKLLKHAVCAAEQSLSEQILRKVSPKEAELLKDKCMQSRVRFRFGGFEFPPHIYFKIYTGSGQGTGVKYVSGKKMIKPASEAARDACDLMGHRKFYDQLIQDTIQHETHKITDEIDVTTLKDYMQYLSHLDETPSYMGGRDNSWRKLTLEALPRQTIFYDIVDYLYNHKMSALLQQELPGLLAQPLSQDAQLQHIHIISQLRELAPVPSNPTPKSKLTPGTPTVSSRRSKRALTRVIKMRRMYEQGVKTSDDYPESSTEQYTFVSDCLPSAGHPDNNDLPPMDEEWEEEAEKLYEWTQELSFDELVATPRLPTAQNQFGVTY